MLFREKALIKLKSPEQLDESLKVICRNNRAVWLTLLGLALFGLTWGSFGYMPEIGRGQGILVTPNSVVPLQVRASGQIARWHVSVGDFVEKGQVLGLLEQPEIDQELKQSLGKLEEVTERNRIVGELRGRYSETARKAVTKQREMLHARIDYLQGYIEETKTLSETLHQKNTELLDEQRRNLAKSKEHAVSIKNAMQGRLESYKRLRKEKLMSEDSLQMTRRNYDDAVLKMRDLDLSSQDLNLKEVQLTESYLNTQELIAARENNLTFLRLQLRELDNSEAQLDKSDSEFKFRQENDLNEVKRSIERARKQLSLNREIKSEYSGKILELTVSEGQFVNQGQRVAQIDARDPDSELVALAYFQAKEGKQLHPGMPIRVSPSVVSQKEHGSMIGHVLSLSDYPVTVDAVVNYVGNSAVAQRLLVDNHQIEVFVRLDRDETSPSGYAWTSGRGPDVQITAGTLADIWVTVERRNPISFIIPKVKKWCGL